MTTATDYDPADYAPWSDDEPLPPNGTRRRGDAAQPGAVDVWDFLDEPEPVSDWVIPGILEKRDRLILTGPEGGGKSTFKRQVGVQAAAGVHPFTLDDITPVRVMIVDQENSRRQTRKAMRPLALSAGRERLAAGRLAIRVESGAVDLRHIDEADALTRDIEAHRTELLLIGPLYKLASGDPTSEEDARTVALRLDRIRDAVDCAIVIEAHTPHASTVGGRRPQRPYGASLWLRWPEFGIHLGETGVLTHWRGPRDERDWPSALRRGGDWPWTIAEPKVQTWALILGHCRDAGEALSIRELAERIGVSKSTVSRAIDANRTEWDRLLGDLGEQP